MIGCMCISFQEILTIRLLERNYQAHHLEQQQEHQGRSNNQVDNLVERKNQKEEAQKHLSLA